MQPEAAERDNVGPRYQQVSRIIQSRIEDGQYALGSLLPTEIELCEEFEISRHTIREALRRLTEAGLVRRRQGSGTQVVASGAPKNYVHSMRSLSELFQYASDTEFKITDVTIAVPEAEYAPLMGGEASDPWLRIEGVRLGQEGEAPICFTVVFINSLFADLAPSIRQHRGAIYSLLESHSGRTVADVEQQITGEPISRKAARKLGTSTRIWAIRVARRYIGADGKLMMVSINYHPGDHFSYTMHLRREGSKDFA